MKKEVAGNSGYLLCDGCYSKEQELYYAGKWLLCKKCTDCIDSVYELYKGKEWK